MFIAEDGAHLAVEVPSPDFDLANHRVSYTLLVSVPPIVDACAYLDALAKESKEEGLGQALSSLVEDKDPGPIVAHLKGLAVQSRDRMEAGTVAVAALQMISKGILRGAPLDWTLLANRQAAIALRTPVNLEGATQEETFRKRDLVAGRVLATTLAGLAVALFRLIGLLTFAVTGWGALAWL